MSTGSKKSTEVPSRTDTDNEPTLALTTHVLFWVTMVLHWPKAFEIANTSCPFVPMRQTIADMMEFQPSLSTRSWLATHYCLAGLNVTLLFLITGAADHKTAVGQKRTATWWKLFRLSHIAFTAVIVANCDRFGNLPFEVALAVNLGVIVALNVAYLGNHWWVYSLILGIPSFLEAIIFVFKPFEPERVTLFSILQRIVTTYAFVLVPILHIPATFGVYRDTIAALYDRCCCCSTRSGISHSD